MNRNTSNDSDEIADLLRDLLITSLGSAGVKQTAIRKIVGCDINRVNQIVKHIERGHSRGKEQQ